jgi:predicted 3-demethylubiquinone-9 3-methyltransferase (glyoxalase superfamily)
LEGSGSAVACGWLKNRFWTFLAVTPTMLPELLAGPDRSKGSRLMQAMMKMVRLDIPRFQVAAEGK